MYVHTDTDTDTVGNFHIRIRLYSVSRYALLPYVCLANPTFRVSHLARVVNVVCTCGIGSRKLQRRMVHKCRRSCKHSPARLA